MKNSILILCLALSGLYACNTSKEVVKQPTDVVEDEGTTPENVDHGSAPSTIERVKGVVRMEENCGAIIQVIYGDVIYRYYPMNLEEKYKKDGLAIKFAFTIPDAVAVNTKCEAVSEYISVSDVTPVR